MTYPFNDDEIIYDYIAHRYVLTANCVMKSLGVDLNIRLNKEGNANPTEAVEYALKEISQKLYAYIYSRNPRFKMYIEYVLAKYPPCRGLLIELLINEVAYSLKNGDFYSYAGINVAKGTAMNLATLRDNRIVSPFTESAILEPLPNGVVLGYQGFYSLPPIKYREDY